MKRVRVVRILVVFMVCTILSGCSMQQSYETYVFPDVYVDAEQLVKDIKGKKCKDIYENEDGSVTVVLTEEQRENWLRGINTDFRLTKQMGILSIECSKDYKNLTARLPEKIAEGAAPMIQSYVWCAEMAQILSGSEDWSVEVTIIENETNKIQYQGTLPEDELDWSFLEK